MNRLVIFLLFAGLIVSCKSKKKKNNELAENFIVSEYLKGQVAKLDTSSYVFQKIEIVNGHSDTTPIKNSEVRAYAKDFLELPDLSKGDIREDYTIHQLFDDLQEAFVFTYTTAENHPIREEHVTVEPQQNQQGTNDIRSVYVNYAAKEGNAEIEKKMMWEHRNFYIVTVITTPNKPEQIKTVKIVWNGFNGETK